METATCSVRLCRQPASDKSPITCQPRCNLHMQADVSEVQKSESAVAERIAHFKKYGSPLRMMQQRLASDLHLLDDSFHELQQTVDRCKTELLGTITRQHDQLLDSLKVVGDIQDFENELRTAKEANDTRLAFILNKSMERSLETLQLDSKLLVMDEGTQQVRMVAFPDVNARVRELRACAEMQMRMVRNVIESLDVANKEQKEFPPIKSTETKVELEGKPACMALCDNTSGFVIDGSGSIARAQAAIPDCKELPQPSVFVAVQQLSTVKETATAADNSGGRILLLSADSQVAARVSCSWDAQQPITGLHCDSHLQLLFIAQQQAVTVTDLSGALHSRIAVSDIQDGAQKLHCIAGDSDKLFVAATLGDGQPAIFGLAKESGEVQVRLPVTCVTEFNDGMRIEVQDRMLMLHADNKMHTICTITNMLLRSESVDEAIMFQSELSVCDGQKLATFAKVMTWADPRLSRFQMPSTMLLASLKMQFLCVDRAENQSVFLALVDEELRRCTIQIGS